MIIYDAFVVLALETAPKCFFICRKKQKDIMPLLLLTDPVTLIYDTISYEVFLMKKQKMWYASSVADGYRDTLLAMFKKEEAGVKIDVDSLLLETGMSACPPEKALALLEHVAIELVAALAKEKQYQLQHTKLVSLMHRKLDDKREIQESMLTKFNVLLNEKKKEIATLRQGQSMNMKVQVRGGEEEGRPQKTRKKVAPKASTWDEFLKKRKEAASAKKVEAPPASSDSDGDDDDISDVSIDLLGGGIAAIKGKPGPAVNAKKAESLSSPNKNKNKKATARPTKKRSSSSDDSDETTDKVTPAKKASSSDNDINDDSDQTTDKVTPAKKSRTFKFYGSSSEEDF